MQHQEFFSAEEMLRLLKDVGVDAFREVDAAPTSGVVVRCEKGDVDFVCVLGGGVDAYGHVALLSIRTVSCDPFDFVDHLNQELRYAAARVCIDESGDAECDELGDPMVMLRQIVVFDGGVTPTHVTLLLSYWLEELYEFFGLDDSTGGGDTVADGSIRELGLAEQIQWILSADGIPRTAKQLSTFLMTPRHDVNRELYRLGEVFFRNDSQPPLWSVAR